MIDWWMYALAAVCLVLSPFMLVVLIGVLFRLVVLYVVIGERILSAIGAAWSSTKGPGR